MSEGRFSPFVPRIAADPRLGVEGRITRTAVTMFADIAGFTGMSERLGGCGTAGTEQLGAVVRRALGGAIDAADEAGGDTLAFGGDAITVTFARGDEDAWVRARRAASTIVDIVAATNGTDTLIGPLELSVRIGVAAGRVTSMVSARRDRDVLVHLGPGLDLAVAAADQATPGTVVVRHSDDEPDEVLAGRQDPVRARRSVHPLIASRLEEGMLPHGKHRWVSVVFVSLAPVDDRDASALDRLGRTVGIAGRLFDELGGELVQCTGGDKGLVLFGAFGAPIAHADDPARAVHLAERLRHETGEPMSAGVSTGLTFVSYITGTRRAFLQLVGDTVNQGARLMNAAPAGGTLIEHRTQRAAGRSIVVADEQLLSVKGRAVPLVVHRVTSLTGQIGAYAVGETPLVGRDREVDTIVAAVQGCRSGAGSLVHVEGEAGLGKTRVVAEVARRLELLGIIVECEHFDGYGLGRSYGPFRRLLARRLGLAPGAGAPELEAALARAAPGDDGMLPLVAGVLGVHVDDALTRRSPAEEQAELTRRAVVALLGSVTQPTALVVEDVHWADEASAAVLASLAQVRGNTQLSVVTTRRPAGAGHRWIQGPVVELDDLSDDALATVVRDTWSSLGGARLDDESVAQIVERSAGSPLSAAMVCELVRLTWSPGRPLPDVALHEELLGFLAERLDTLPADLDQLALELAIVGRPISAVELGAIYDHEPTVVERDLDRLAAIGVLRRTAEGHELRHATIGEALRERASHADRAPLHRAVARWLIAEHRAPREIAGHLEHARTSSGNVDWFAAARDDARRTWSVREAHHWAELAVATSDPAPDDILALVELEIVLGRYLTAEERLTALDVARLPRRDRADRRRMLGKLLLETGRLAEGVVQLREAEREGASGPELSWPMTMALCDLGRFDEAEARARRRLANGDADVRLDALANLGVALARRGDFASAAAALEQAVAVADESGDIMRLIHATSDLAGVRFETGALEESVRLLERATALAQRIGAHRAVTMALGNHAQLRLAVADLAGAERAAAAASSAALQLPDAGLALSFAETPIVVAEATGNGDRARRWWQRHAGLELALGRRHDAAISLLRIAALYGQDGRAGEAGGCMAHADQLLAETDAADDVNIHVRRARRSVAGIVEGPPEVLDTIDVDVDLAPLDASIPFVEPGDVDELLDRIEALVRAEQPNAGPSAPDGRQPLATAQE